MQNICPRQDTINSYHITINDQKSIEMHLSMNPAIIALNGKLTPPLPSWRYSTSLASHTNCHYRHPLISHGTRYLYIILHVPKRDIATRQNETTIFQGALHNGKVTSLVQTKYWIICIATATLSFEHESSL